jgi:hypothetical protein
MFTLLMKIFNGVNLMDLKIILILLFELLVYMILIKYKVKNKYYYRKV